jgi:signal transduction histidine kinase/predicted RNA-binding protein with RPS1 domain
MTSLAEHETAVNVKIRRILPFGLLVSLDDGRTGIVREREIAWDRDGRRRWREHYSPGDTLTAVPLGEGRDQRLELSIRLAQYDPWNDLPARYQLGQVVRGRVTGLRPYGVFVEIEPGITGLLHRSRLPAWAQRDAIADLFWPGDLVQLAIELIDITHRRLRLSLSYAWNQRWKEAAPRAEPERELRADGGPVRLPLELLLEQTAPFTILIVEDDPVQLDASANWLRQSGQYLVTAPSAEVAFTILEGERPNLVLMDLGLPGMDGIAALRRISSDRPDARCVLMTDWASANQRLAELEELRAAGVRLLIKPVLPEDLLSLLFDTLGEKPDRPVDIAPAGATVPAAVVARLPDGRGRLDESLAQLRLVTRAAKAVLFALDPAQRRVAVVAEAGNDALRAEALTDLVYSPVRDVAEDARVVRFENVSAHHAEARVRYLKPLLDFKSCLGLPLPGELAERYALFLFWSREYGCNDVHEAYANAVAISTSAMVEREQFHARMAEMQQLALLGQLSRALVHEINHQLSPINFALTDLEAQSARIERLLATSPDMAEAEARQARTTLGYLVKGVRRLTETARLFGRVTIHSPEQVLCLNTAIDEVAWLVRDMAERAHITIEIAPAPALYAPHMPAVQVQQILLNVVINAVQQISLLRPAQGGRIQIRMSQERREQHNSIQVVVEDDGPGIHRRLWERVFELGFTTRGEGGSGLGLYITRSLAETLGGRVWVVDSSVLWGTTVAVELPAAPPADTSGLHERHEEDTTVA